MEQEKNAGKTNHTTPSITFKASPERKLIRASGSKRYVDFFIHVEKLQREEEPQRPPLKLALVLDRSGSMYGEKLRMAKTATLAVLDQLTGRDSVAVTIFDSSIDVIQKLAPVTPELKRQMRSTLQEVQARANTALHEGWLTGCKALTAEDSPSEKDALARCFLLTDGIANVGVTDPERIASEAAGVREHTGISTSTFGIGNDYNELLLGPMAVAGGGQFHHLRTPDEITRTFVGELGGMLAVAARQVRLEFEVEPGVNADLVSSYWENSETERTTQRSIAIGDLQSDEERHVIVRFDFPEQGREDQHLVRARVVWQADEGEMTTEWQELRFVYASNSACDDEPQNAEIMHQVGLHEVDRARREAVRHNNQGDYEAARAALQFPRRMRAISSYAQHDAFLQNELKELDALEEQILSTPIAAPMAKEVYYQQQIRSRGQQDYRQTENKTDDEKDRDEKKPPKKRPWQ